MKYKMIFLKGVCASLAALLLTACSSKENGQTAPEGQAALKVVATNSIIADLAQEVGGEQIALHSIVPVGTDPHEYEPLPEDTQKASDADVILYNGLNLESGNGWFEKLMETAAKEENQDYFAVSKTVEPQYLTSEGNRDQEDPHAWLDIANGIRYVAEIEQIFAEKDPANASYYHQNATAYTEKLTTLDQNAKTEFADIPEAKKLLVTSEGAFKYFSNAYGLTAAYIWEINTESQGTPEQMTAIIDTIKAAKVPVLFVETSVDPRSMERLSQETGLPIYAQLFTDSLAKAGETGDTYYDMMQWNLEQIHAGLTQ